MEDAGCIALPIADFGLPIGLIVMGNQERQIGNRQSAMTALTSYRTVITPNTLSYFITRFPHTSLRFEPRESM